MATAARKFTTDAFAIDSFLFHRRRFFRKNSGFEWNWDLFCDKEFLTDLDFRIWKDSDGGTALLVRYMATDESIQCDYRVRLDNTPCRRGGRWWFLCPRLRDDGEPCGKRCRHLYLKKGDGRFGCRRCAGLKYERDVRNHNPVYLGYVRPAEALKRATIALLRCRSAKRTLYLEAQADAARTRLAEFSKWWLEIAARVIAEKAGPRARGYFDELAGLLVSARERELIDELARENSDDEQAEGFSTGLLPLRDELLDGVTEIGASEHSQEFQKAASDPKKRPMFVLVSLITHRIARQYKESNEDCALAFMAAPQYLEKIAADPEALMNLVEFAERSAEKHMQRRIAEVSATAKREESDDLEDPPEQLSA